MLQILASNSCFQLHPSPSKPAPTANNHPILLLLLFNSSCIVVVITCDIYQQKKEVLHHYRFNAFFFLGSFSITSYYSEWYCYKYANY